MVVAKRVKRILGFSAHLAPSEPRGMVATLARSQDTIATHPSAEKALVLRAVLPRLTGEPVEVCSDM